jgi:hypothetical protein
MKIQILALEKLLNPRNFPISDTLKSRTLSNVSFYGSLALPTFINVGYESIEMFETFLNWSSGYVKIPRWMAPWFCGMRQRSKKESIQNL